MLLKPHPHTLVGRLTLLFGLGAVSLLTLFSASTDWVLRHEFRQDENRVLDDTVGLLQSVLSRKSDLIVALRREIPEDLEALHFHNYQIQVTGEDGALLFSTSRFPQFSGEFRSQLPCYQPGQLGDGVVWNRGTESFLVMSALARPPHGQKVRLWVALDISRQTATLQSYRHWLAAGIGLGVLIAVLATGQIARHALRPLAKMQDRVSHLRVDELSTRLGQEDWPQELQPLALEFDRLLEEVSQGLDRLSSFSADLAHELRTPLTSLILMCEVTLGQTRTLAQYQEVLSSNMEELERLSSLVDRLLLLARTEASRGQVSCSPVALAPLLERLVDFYLSDIESVKLEISPDLNVCGEVRLMEISIGNILSNARKYARPPIEVIWTGEQLEIRDSGPGIEAVHLPRLFERLYRVDSSRQQSQPGYGLGLALVESAMKAQGGGVEVTSSPQGTIFRLTFAKL